MTRGVYGVDASVGIKLFVPEPLSQESDALFAALRAPAAVELFVPDLFYPECTNILWKYTRRFGYPANTAVESIERLRELPLTVVPAIGLLSEALTVAIRYNISGYDACYVAMCGQLDVQLITADEKLIRKLDGSPFDVHWLGALALPDA